MQKARGTVAIDGPAASGKSTVGEAIARELGYLFLDTGLMYRAFTLAAQRADIPATDAERCTAFARNLDLRVRVGHPTVILLDGEDVTEGLRTPAVEAEVSGYSAIAGVRAEMVRLQREVAMDGGAVLAGRDIGTVVLPDADVKLFLTATEEARAHRRQAQAAANWGATGTEERTKNEIAGRDRVDSSRAVSPLEPAKDAVVLDTSEMTLDEVLARAMDEVRCAGLA